MLYNLRKRKLGFIILLTLCETTTLEDGAVRPRARWIFHEMKRKRDGFKGEKRRVREERRYRRLLRTIGCYSPVWRYDKTYFRYAAPHFHKYAKTVTAARRYRNIYRISSPLYSEEAIARRDPHDTRYTLSRARGFPRLTTNTFSSKLNRHY